MLCVVGQARGTSGLACLVAVQGNRHVARTVEKVERDRFDLLAGTAGAVHRIPIKLCNAKSRDQHVGGGRTRHGTVARQAQSFAREKARRSGAGLKGNNAPSIPYSSTGSSTVGMYPPPVITDWNILVSEPHPRYSCYR